MSRKHEELEWHLTPRGWVRGNAEPPADRLLTMSCQESGHSIDCREVWSSGAMDQIKPLLEKFGPGPASEMRTEDGSPRD